MTDATTAMSDRVALQWRDLVQQMSDGKRVSVSNANIDSLANFGPGLVAGEVTFTDCVFRGKVEATRVSFGESVVFIRCDFPEGIRLHGCRIQGDLFASQSTVESEAYLEGLTVAGQVFFENCTFASPVNLSLAHVGGFARFTGSVFKQGAQFLHATFDSALMLDVDRSEGDFDLAGASVRGTIHVPGTAAFDTNLDLRRLDAASSVTIELGKFAAGAQLRLTRARIGGDLTIRDGELSATTAACIDAEQMSVLGNVQISGVTCKATEAPRPGAEGDHSLVKLRGSRIQGYVVLQDDAIHGVTGKSVDMSDVSVGGNTYLLTSSFTGRADFNRAVFGDIFGTDSVFRGLATFEGSVFRRASRFLDGCRFDQEASFFFARFQDEANFGGATVATRLDLRYAQFHALLFELKNMSPNWPQEITLSDAAVVDLRGCAYETLVLPRDFAGLPQFIDRISPEDSPALVFLERFLRRSGRTRDADSVRRRRHDEEGRRSSAGSREWWWNRFYGSTTAYGTVILRMFFIAIIFGIVGGTIEQWELVTGWRLGEWPMKMIKLASVGIVAVASALAIDALRVRFSVNRD